MVFIVEAEPEASGSARAESDRDMEASQQCGEVYRWQLQSRLNTLTCWLREAVMRESYMISVLIISNCGVLTLLMRSSLCRPL
jgi:hypothetical protein